MDSPKIEIRYSKAQLLLLSILSYVFAAVALYTLIFCAQKGTSVFVLILFIAVGSFFLRFALDRRPKLIISTEGIYAEKFKRSVIPWNKIVDVIRWNAGRVKMVAIVTDDDLTADLAAKSDGGVYTLKDDRKRWYSVHGNNLELNPDELAKLIKQLLNADEFYRSRLLSEYPKK